MADFPIAGRVVDGGGAFTGVPGAGRMQVKVVLGGIAGGILLRTSEEPPESLAVGPGQEGRRGRVDLPRMAQEFRQVVEGIHSGTWFDYTNLSLAAIGETIYQDEDYVTAAFLRFKYTLSSTGSGDNWEGVTFDLHVNLTRK